MLRGNRDTPNGARNDLNIREIQSLNLRRLVAATANSSDRCFVRTSKKDVRSNRVLDMFRGTTLDSINYLAELTVQKKTSKILGLTEF